MQFAQLKKTIQNRLPPVQLETLVILLTGSLLALAVRFVLRGFVSGDAVVALVPWYERVKAEGLASLSYGFSNYTPLYLYTDFLISKIFPHLSSVTSIKIPSVVSDFIGAYFAYKIVRERLGSSFAASLAYSALLFAPTVILNGALWGQIDMMFTCFLLGGFYYFQKNKPIPACLCVGLAFAVKFQTVFLAPFLLILLLKRRVSIPQLLLIPAVYLVTILPSWLLGRNLLNMLMIYFSQTGQIVSPATRTLTAHYPNLYAWLPDSSFDYFLPGGLLWSAGLVFLYILFGYKSRRELNPDLMIELALVSVVLLPFILPTMHERYGFPADVFSILYGFFFPRRVYIPLAINLLSFFSYYPFLFRSELFPQKVLAIFTLAVVCLLVYFLVKRLFGVELEPSQPVQV